MRRVIAFLCLAVLMLPAATRAQEQITPEAFLDIAVGRTLSFRGLETDTLVGVEQFLRRDLSVWAGEDGRCTYGRIEIRGPLLCFLYEDFTDPDNCWMPFNDAGQLLVVSRSSFEVQRISDISDTPVECRGAPLS
ncbi:hypothetical protein ABMC89_00995 [Sulfitobacter sp. HNIBRBA3233]|uniref:hypothetical protein n=1 Tax=Sulfitobacter marinivivus TaxID=3158558 RepID=UPI0032DE6EE7